MKLRILWDDLQTSLWFVPTLWIGSLGVLALLLITLDQRLSSLELHRLLPWLFIDGAEGARTMLGSIGTAMLTVATLAFSIIMLAVVQMANAYSPRILRQYLGDTDNQHVLGILIGTFLYSLLVMRVVRSTDENLFVPTLSVTVAILLALLSTAAFVYFVNHVAHSIEVSAVVTAIQRESQEILELLYPNNGPPLLPDESDADLLAFAPLTVPSRHSGYIEAVAVEPLLDAAREAKGRVRLERLVGEYVLAGTPLATVWAAPPEQEGLVRAVHGQVTLGRERTMVQDLAYGIRQLSDVALRAISPAVNDPSTAINCIDVLAALLAELLHRAPLSPYYHDAGGTLRLIVPHPTFEALLDSAFNQIRQYAANDYACTLRLLEVCTDLALLATRPSERAALWKHIVMVGRSADRHLHEPWDRDQINHRLRRAAHTLGQEPRALLLEAYVDLAAYQEERGG